MIRDRIDFRILMVAWPVASLLLAAFSAGCSDEQSSPTNANSPQGVNGGNSSPVRNSADGSPNSSGLILTEVTALNLQPFMYRNGEESGHVVILESLGGGVALCDFDRDGRLDVFMPGGGILTESNEIRGRPSALLWNRGNWKFTPVTAEAGIAADRYYTHGASAADYDNDGFADVLVTGFGGLQLLHNMGDGTFQQVATAAGLDDHLWSSSAAWGDLNGDGNLDLYVAHYIDWSFENNPNCPGPKPGQREICPPRRFNGLPDTLYLSNSDGTFRDASKVSGLKAGGKSLGVLIADIDLDGDSDIYVVNDQTPNFLYANDGRGHLEEIGLVSGTAFDEYGVSNGSMGVDIGDFNLDGLPDLWVTNYERENFALYRNFGNHSFRHVSATTKISAIGGLNVGWGTAFVDFDSDGDEDIFVSNGHVIRFPANAPVKQLPLLLENHDAREFTVAESVSSRYMRIPHMGRGLAVGDIDNDGDIDLVVSHINEPIALLSNETANSNHWISFQLIGIRSNRDAIGAIVRIRTADGKQMRQVKGGGSYASSSDPRVFFGLGKQSRVKRIEVRWPSGTRQVLENIETNQMLRLTEPREL